MTESQINYFLAVAREKSISKASEALFVSQPAVSKQIALLEAELGCKLFERHTRGLELTASGRAFEKLFLDFRIRLKETIEAARAENSVLSGKYILGAFEGWQLSEFCLDMFRELSEKYPQVEFEVQTYSIDQIIYALKRGEVNDILATEAILDDHPELTTRHVCTIRSLLLFSSKHPLAGKEGLSLADFADMTFYITAPQNLIGGISSVLTMCKNEGFVPKIEYLPSLSAVYNKLQTGSGVFFTNEWIMSKDNPIFSYLILPYEAGVGFAYLKEDKDSPFSVIRDDVLDYYERKYTNA
ncbi:MAG: LysR family transcriptional regulator [Lachnospiraceae bacterium]|nr:LysR family transcriptional regulator [Lachnospiraceae bacterium]